MRLTAAPAFQNVESTEYLSEKSIYWIDGTRNFGKIQENQREKQKQPVINLKSIITVLYMS